MESINRRTFLKHTVVLGGSLLAYPLISSCELSVKEDPSRIPIVKPKDWDPIAFNRIRGNAGAIPESYLKDINGPDGEKKHLGKHLPYIPEMDSSLVPKRYLPIMWGDPAKGYVPHPNAVPNPSKKYPGHWYNWIRIRKSSSYYSEDAISKFSEWPRTQPGDTGKYDVFGTGEMTRNGGVNTIYMALLPPDVKKGDVIRIWAHCVTHGEYVDFIKI